MNLKLRGYLTYEARAKRQEEKLRKLAEKEQRRAKLRAGIRKQEAKVVKYKKQHRPKGGGGWLANVQSGFSGLQRGAAAIQKGASALEGTPRKRKPKKRKQKSFMH